MKKGTTIKSVVIGDNGFVTAYYDDGTKMKLTRSQRNVLSNYKDKSSYIDNIHKEFDVKTGLLSDDFVVIKNGEIVYDNMHK